MTIKRCPGCSRGISQEASRCPACGFVFSQDENEDISNEILRPRKRERVTFVNRRSISNKHNKWKVIPFSKNNKTIFVALGSIIIIVLITVGLSSLLTGNTESNDYSSTTDEIK